MSSLGSRFFKKLKKGDYNRDQAPAQKPKQDDSPEARRARRAARLKKQKEQGVSRYGQTK